MVSDTIFTVSAIDDFSETLDELEEDLWQVEAAAEKADPVDIDTAIAEAMSDLATYRGALASIPDEKTVDINTDAEGFEHLDMAMMREGMPLFGRNARDLDEELSSLTLFPDDADSYYLDKANPNKDAHGFTGNMNDELIQSGFSPFTGGSKPTNNEWRELFFPDSPFDFTDDDTDVSAHILPDADAGPGGMLNFPDTRIGGGDGRGLGQMTKDIASDFGDLRLSMGLFMNLLASLLPLMGVFIGAIPAAVAGIVALGAAAIASAGALAGVAGLGLLGLATTGGEFDFAQLKERLQGLIDDFLAAFSPLGDAFAPLMSSIMDNMSMMFLDVAMHMQSLTTLTDEARTIANGLMGALGDVIEQTILFGRAAMPVLTGLMNFFANVGFAQAFADILADTLPMLTLLASHLVAVIPAVIKVSMGFLTIATTLTVLFTSLLQVIDVVPFLSQILGTLVATLLVAISASALYSLAQTQMMARIAAVATEIAAVYIPALHAHIAATIGATGATIALTIAALTLIGILTFGLVPILTSVSSGFGVVGNDIDSATSSLKDFNRIAGRTSMDGFGMGGTGEINGPRYSKPSGPTTTSGTTGSGGNTTVIAPDQETGNQLVSTLDFYGDSSGTENSDTENRLHSGE